MNEILINVLIVVFYILILFGCVGAIFSAFYLRKLAQQMTQENGRIRTETSQRVAGLRQEVTEMKKFLEDGFKGHVEASKSLLQFMKDGFDGNVELAKQQVEASAKHAESVMKLDTDNCQKLYDTLVVSVQMMNLILQGLGYQPRNPDDNSGLKDVPDGSNYNRPPAPKDESGLTYARR